MAIPASDCFVLVSGRHFLSGRFSLFLLCTGYLTSSFFFFFPDPPAASSPARPFLFTTPSRFRHWVLNLLVVVFCPALTRGFRFLPSPAFAFFFSCFLHGSLAGRLAGFPLCHRLLTTCSQSCGVPFFEWRFPCCPLQTAFGIMSFRPFRSEKFLQTVRVLSPIMDLCILSFRKVPAFRSLPLR